MHIFCIYDYKKLLRVNASEKNKSNKYQLKMFSFRKHNIFYSLFNKHNRYTALSFVWCNSDDAEPHGRNWFHAIFWRKFSFSQTKRKYSINKKKCAEDYLVLQWQPSTFNILTSLMVFLPQPLTWLSSTSSTNTQTVNHIVVAIT